MKVLMADGTRKSPRDELISISTRLKRWRVGDERDAEMVL